MSLTTVNHGTTTEQEIKADPATEQNLNTKVGVKKTLLNFTVYLTVAAASFPLVFTTVVFGIASMGHLGDSVSKVLLG